MANEIQAPAASGKTLYALIRSGTAQVWNPTLNSGAGGFEAFTAGNYGSYALALTEQGTTGYYAGTFPAGISTPGPYNVDVRQQAGGSPAQSDPNVAGGTFTWSGASETSTATARVTTNADKTGYTVSTVQDKTGYGLAAGDATAATVAANLNATVSSRAAPAQILATPANLLATDGTGKVGANNLPADYQQRGVAVTLPSTVLGSGDHTAIQADLAAALNAAPGSLTPESIAEAVVIARAALAGKVTISADGKTVTWYRRDGATPAFSRTFPASVASVPILPETVTTTA